MNYQIVRITRDIVFAGEGTHQESIEKMVEHSKCDTTSNFHIIEVKDNQEDEE